MFSKCKGCSASSRSSKSSSRRATGTGFGGGGGGGTTGATGTGAALTLRWYIMSAMITCYSFLRRDRLGRNGLTFGSRSGGELSIILVVQLVLGDLVGARSLLATFNALRTHGPVFGALQAAEEKAVSFARRDERMRSAPSGLWSLQSVPDYSL